MQRKCVKLYQTGHTKVGLQRQSRWKSIEESCLLTLSTLLTLTGCLLLSEENVWRKFKSETTKKEKKCKVLFQDQTTGTLKNMVLLETAYHIVKTTSKLPTSEHALIHCRLWSRSVNDVTLQLHHAAVVDNYYMRRETESRWLHSSYIIQVAKSTFHILFALYCRVIKVIYR